MSERAHVGVDQDKEHEQDEYQYVDGGHHANTLIVLDRDLFTKAWLRPTVVKRVAETADSMDAVIIGELTLEFGNEAAAGMIENAS